MVDFLVPILHFPLVLDNERYWVLHGSLAPPKSLRKVAMRNQDLVKGFYT